MYAAGKIPGGFIKRESRPSDRATLTARMTDRPIRPLFADGWRNETQVIATTLSVDQVNAFDILAINGASAALMISELPFQGPVGAVRIGLIGDEFIINPTLQESEESELDLVVAGTPDAISMVEAGAKEIDEETMLEALQIAHDEIKTLCAAQIELQKKAGKAKWDIAGAPVDEDRLAAQKAEIVANFSAQASAFYTSGHLLDDGVIDPRDTRAVLAFVLATAREAEARQPRAVQFGVARF